MSYKISHKFCWYNHGSSIVKMYFINEVPFTFDEMPDGHLHDQDLIREADKNKDYDMEDLYLSSSYLVEEEAHPLMFELELENPEDLPVDWFQYLLNKTEENHLCL